MSVKTADLVAYLEERDWHQVAFGMWVHKDMDEETYTLEQAVACEKQMETKQGQ